MTYQHAEAIAETMAPIAIADRDSVTKAIENACLVVERRASYEVLKNIHVSGHGHYATMTASDSDMVVSTVVPCAADSRIDTSLPAFKLRDLLKKAPVSDDIKLVQDVTDMASIKTGSTTYKLETMEYDKEYILPFPMPGVASFELPAQWLLETLASVSPAISKEETRYYLNGIFVHVANGVLSFVATDGHKLIRRQIEAPRGSEFLHEGMIIPNKAILTAIKLLKAKDCPESIMIAGGGNRHKTRFYIGNVTLTTKLIDGTFPNYERIIPSNNPHKLVVTAKDMATAIIGAIAIADTKTPTVRFDLDETTGIQTCNYQNGVNQSVSEFSGAYNGESMGIGFNSGYVQTLLKALSPKGGDFCMHFNPGSPAWITGEIEGLDAVLMPMRA